MTTLGITILLIVGLLLITDPILRKLKGIDIIKSEKKWMLFFVATIALTLIFNPFVRTQSGFRTFVETVNGN